MPIELIAGKAKKSARFWDDQLIFIGNDSACELRIRRDDVAPRHCLLSRQAGVWFAFDLKSDAGTLHNGRPLRKAALADGDCLSIGGLTIKCRLLPGREEKVPRRSRARDGVLAPPAGGAAVGAAGAPPETVRGFRLDKRLHHGASGDFHLAYWPSGSRWVVLKLIPARLAGDEEDMYRFCRGVSAAGEIRDPHIVRLYRAGRSKDYWYLVMEWLEGGSLQDKLPMNSERGLAPEFVTRMAIDVCKGLESAARHGLVHRKVMPSSILFNREGRAKLGDFVLTRGVVQDTLHRLTLAGQSVGDYAYMSPEQATGKTELDQRSDLFSLGTTLYRALTGRHPFASPRLPDTLRNVCTQPVTPPRTVDPDIPAALETVVLRALEKDPSRRFDTARDMRAALEQVGLLEAALLGSD